MFPCTPDKSDSNHPSRTVNRDSKKDRRGQSMRDGSHVQDQRPPEVIQFLIKSMVGHEVINHKTFLILPTSHVHDLIMLRDGVWNAKVTTNRAMQVGIVEEVVEHELDGVWHIRVQVENALYSMRGMDSFDRLRERTNIVIQERAQSRWGSPRESVDAKIVSSRANSTLIISNIPVLSHLMRRAANRMSRPSFETQLASVQRVRPCDEHPSGQDGCNWRIPVPIHVTACAYRQGPRPVSPFTLGVGEL